MMKSSIVGNLSEAALACQKKMEKAHVSHACQTAFLTSHRAVEQGSTGFISESSILPASGLVTLESLSPSTSDELLNRTVALKLNGGLGTGMGLDGPKSLLVVKDGNTFLDFIVRHIGSTRTEKSSSKKDSSSSGKRKGVRFMLLNSFSTTEGTTAFMKKHYPELGDTMKEVELMQNQVPKVLTDTLKPVEWPADPLCEWVPPGHGDLYSALYGSGRLDQLLAEGYEYMFVSNSDNLGATVEPRILHWMATEHLPFVMEVCRRLESDKKGGHLARSATKNNGLLLRESAQCPPEDTSSFQDIQKHCFFNTNNLWINLSSLKKLMEEHNGMIELPVIRNEKTVDPTNSSSPKVFQLETAMGSAISQFNGAAAVLVPRERFAPVKTCNDLLVLRSDAYVVTTDHRLVLHPDCHSTVPLVMLDGRYKLINEFEQLIAHGVPSLVHCRRLEVKGPVVFGSRVVLKGDVVIENKDTTKTLRVPDGMVIENATFSG